MRNSPVHVVKKNAVDPRHGQVKALLDEYWRNEMPSIPSLPWGAADAGALGQFLRANPALTTAQIGECLNHRLVSHDHAPGERVHIWIGSILRYAQGPLDRFKLPRRQAGPAATVGIYNPEDATPIQSPTPTIREQMGDAWFNIAVHRWHEGGSLSPLQRDALREAGIL